MRELPTGAYPDGSEGVTLSATRIQEASAYLDHDRSIASLHRLSDICPVMPVHCIVGERQNIV